MLLQQGASLGIDFGDPPNRRVGIVERTQIPRLAFRIKIHVRTTIVRCNAEAHSATVKRCYGPAKGSVNAARRTEHHGADPEVIVM